MTSPRRIASLISSATEMLYALRLGERVVAVSHECDWPPEVAEKPRVTRSLVDAAASSRAIDDAVRTAADRREPLYSIDVDRLAALAPELIVTQAQCDVCAVRYDDVVAAVRERPELRDTQVLSLNPQSLADVLADMARIGEAAGCPDAARAVVSGLEARVLAVRAATGALAPDERPRVCLLEWIDPPMIAGNWMPEMLDWAGGRCELAEAGRHSGFVRWVDVAKFDPEVVILMPCGFDLERTLAEARPLALMPRWGELSAVQSGRIYAVDGNAYFNRSGPRLVDSLELLAHLIHPAHMPASAAVARDRAWRRLVTDGGSLVPAAAVRLE